MEAVYPQGWHLERWNDREASRAMLRPPHLQLGEGEPHLLGSLNALPEPVAALPVWDVHVLQAHSTASVSSSCPSLRHNMKAGTGSHSLRSGPPCAHLIANLAAVGLPQPLKHLPQRPDRPLLTQEALHVPCPQEEPVQKWTDCLMQGPYTRGGFSWLFQYKSRLSDRRIYRMLLHELDQVCSAHSLSRSLSEKP